MTIQPHEAEMRISLGSVGSEHGELSIFLKVKADGRGHLGLYAEEPNNRRKTGVFIALNLEGYNQLRALIRKTDEVIKDLSQKKQLQTLLLPWE